MMQQDGENFWLQRFMSELSASQSADFLSQFSRHLALGIWSFRSQTQRQGRWAESQSVSLLLLE